jgi:2-polyprenyl-3-methyl-5-hydroxy-6-metoxy-1,4-benzoquinol methylase
LRGELQLMMSEDMILFYAERTPDHFDVRGDADLVQQYPWKGNEKVLDAGSGGGFDCKEVSGRVKTVLGIDVLPSMVDYARNNNSAGNITYKTGDIMESYLTENHFDVVVNNWMSFHIENKIELFEKFHSCLKPGGTLLISDTWIHNESLKMDQRFESPATYKKLLSQLFKEVKLIGTKPHDDIFFRFSFKAIK